MKPEFRFRSFVLMCHITHLVYIFNIQHCEIVSASGKKNKPAIITEAGLSSININN